jgi:hypothetical protein
MNLSENIQQYILTIPAEIKENRGLFDFSFVVAERKSFLSRQKLEYKAKFRIDEVNKIVHFSEMLRESGAGLSSGEVSPGFGFKAESYKLNGKGREGTIEEQSNLFGKKYEYKFDFKTIHSRIEDKALNSGYKFAYQILPLN